MKRILLAAIGLVALVWLRRADLPDGQRRVPPTPAASVRDLRRPLLVAAASIVAVASLIVVPRWFAPDVRVTVDVAPQGLRSVTTAGAGAGTLRVSADLRTLAISSAGARERLPQTVELILPVAATSCERVARAVGGGCGSAPRRRLAGTDIEVGADQTILLTLTAAATDGASLAGGRHFASIAVAAERASARISCRVPNEAIELTVAGTPHSLPGACAPGPGAVDLRIALAHRTAPQLDLVGLGGLRAQLPARSATLRVEQPTLVVGDRTTTLLDATATTVAIAATRTGTMAIEGPEIAGRSAHRVSMPRAHSVRVSGHGEQVRNLYVAQRDVWLGLAGVFFGVALSQLAGLFVGARAT